MIANARRQFIYSLVLLILTISSFVFVTYTWFTTRLEQSLEYDPDMGLVDVGIRVYFKDGETFLKEADFVEIVPGVPKPGVYYVNIDSESSLDFIEYLRVDILVYSNVPTHIRVKVYRQLTLIYQDFLGNVTELSVYMGDSVEEELMFYYDTDNWYIDSIYETFYRDDIFIRDVYGNAVYVQTSPGVFTDVETETLTFSLLTSGDFVDASNNLIIRSEEIFNSQAQARAYQNRHFDYIYYQEMVDNIQTIPLLLPYGGNFGTYPSGYSLQIAFTVEAVQAIGGPQNLWGLNTPPWDGEWWAGEENEE